MLTAELSAHVTKPVRIKGIIKSEKYVSAALVSFLYPGHGPEEVSDEAERLIGFSDEEHPIVIRCNGTAIGSFSGATAEVIAHLNGISAHAGIEPPPPPPTLRTLLR